VPFYILVSLKTNKVDRNSAKSVPGGLTDSHAAESRFTPSVSQVQQSWLSSMHAQHDGLHACTPMAGDAWSNCDANDYPIGASCGTPVKPLAGNPERP
jgi:hypothetical protein